MPLELDNMQYELCKDNMQYELCKARLERVSDGCMEFVHPQLIECLLCNMTYNLHKPFNMCRAIRHLKSRHPNLMPEYAGVTPRTPMTSHAAQKAGLPGWRRGVEGGGGQGLPEVELRMVDNIEQLKEYGIDISKMQAMTGADGEQVYVMMPEGTELDPDAASELAAAVARSEGLEILDEESEQQPGTRVFTLALGKEDGVAQQEEGEYKKMNEDDQPGPSGMTNSSLSKQDSLQQQHTPLAVNKTIIDIPMPEPLTTE